MSKFNDIKDLPTGELASFLQVDGSFVSNCKADRNKLSFEHCLKIHEKYKIHFTIYARTFILNIYAVSSDSMRYAMQQ